MRTGPKRIPIKNRFWKYVKKTPTCWLWTGGLAGKGYGVTSIRINGEKTNAYAHRISYEFSKGKIPQGLYVLHKCDTPKCVNPSHLFTGDQFDNMRDAAKKLRTQKGAKHWNSVLNENKVKKIRKSYKHGIRGFGYIATSEKFGVTSSNIERIIKRKTWNHVN